MTVATIGVRSARHLEEIRGDGLATPRSSLSRPGKAPGVSMNERTGLPNFSASFITRSALR